ncbi:butyrate kinase [Clostridium thailandense]|uniref:butyrate kinase n=1 Tax=Clostridium thailandense TaxID=2794346 RepID=UPI003988D918
MEDVMKILAINPGGTSTKISVAEEGNLFLRLVVEHEDEILNSFKTVFDEYEYRMESIKNVLYENGIELKNLDAIVGRGGLLKAVQGGTYEVNNAMVEDVRNAINGEHPSNLGCVLAKTMAEPLGIPAFVVDPVSVDEFDESSRITGMKEISKASWIHALNHKAVCRKTAEDLGIKYEDGNFIACHLGSGISVAAHQKGRMIDGGGGRTDGPFSPERSGALPVYPLILLCYSGKYTKEEMVSKVSKTGGVYDYLGTKDIRVVERNAANGERMSQLVLEAFVRQTAKDIGAYAAVLEGKVDSIVITGSIAHSKTIMEELKKKINFIAPVSIIPGEMEMEALTAGALRVLRGEEESKLYL